MASFIGGLVERPQATRAITLCVAMLSLVHQGVTPASQPQHTLATFTVGQEVCEAMGPLLDEML